MSRNDPRPSWGAHSVRSRILRPGWAGVSAPRPAPTCGAFAALDDGLGSHCKSYTAIIASILRTHRASARVLHPGVGIIRRPRFSLRDLPQWALLPRVNPAMRDQEPRVLHQKP